MSAAIRTTRPMGRCLVIHPGAVGDLLVALPALAQLGALGFERVLAASPRIGALLAGSPLVEAVVGFDDLGLHRLFTTEPDPSALRMLGAYEAVVSWFGAGDSVFRRNLASLASVGRPVVVARAAPPPGARCHVSRHLLETLAPLGPVPASLPPARLAVPEEARAWVITWLRERGLGPGEAVVLHPGAGSPAKVWPWFPALARRLQAAGWPIVGTAGPADAAPVARLVADGGVAEARVARDVPLRRLAALFGEARALVGNDSGPSHLAAAVGCATLALFGPTDPAVWSPVGVRVRVIGGEDPGATDPWAGLTADRVEAGLHDLLGAVRAAR